MSGFYSPDASAISIVAQRAGLTQILRKDFHLPVRVAISEVGLLSTQKYYLEGCYFRTSPAFAPSSLHDKMRRGYPRLQAWEEAPHCFPVG